METVLLKIGIYGGLGAVGAYIANLFGGWDAALITLVIFMAVDYISGLAVAGIFKRSKKTKNGALSSLAGWKGLCKKGMILLIVLVANRLDATMGSNFIRDAVVIAYSANEAISIIENAGMMGLPIPAKLKKAIAALQDIQSQEEKNE